MQSKKEVAQIDLRNGKTVVKKLGGKRITISRVKPKTHRGSVSIIVTIEEHEKDLLAAPR
tara:strand:+ start:268 stop:447 length:180 start_codon:yes stop_codon:yes gene_type:complete